MPAINVELPNGERIEFPEGTPEDTINEAITSFLSPKLNIQQEPVPQDDLQRAARDARSMQQAFGKVLPTGITSDQPIDFGGTTITAPPGQIGLPQVRPPAEAGVGEKVAAGLWNVGAGAVNFPLSPSGVSTLLGSELAPAALSGPLLKLAFGGLMAKGAAEAAGTASVTKDPQDITEAAGSLAALGLIARGGPSLPGAAREALTSLGENLARKRGFTDASRIQKAAEVHGDLQPQPEQGAGQVPAQEGGAGIQPQAQGVAQAAPLSLKSLKYGELTDERLKQLEGRIARQLESTPDDPRLLADLANIRFRLRRTEAHPENDLEAAKVFAKDRYEPGWADSHIANADQVRRLTEEQSKTPIQSLTPEELEYIDSERGSIDAPVDIVDAPLDPATMTKEQLLRAGYHPMYGAGGKMVGLVDSNGKDVPFGQDNPFARQIATIDRATGRVLINPSEFSAWLKAVPEGQKRNAVRSLLAEERIHLAVDDPSAESYWGNLTSLEKAIERKRYTGKWGGAPQFTDTQMGHEALRFRLQQLGRMEPREIAEATRMNRIGLKSITALEDIVRGLRERFATKASLEQLSILDRIQENLGVAKAVAGGADPSAYRKGRKETSEQEFMFLPPPEQGETIQRSVWPQPTPNAIEGAAAAHFDNALKGDGIPSFEAFNNELKGQYGSGISRDASYYAWTDALTKKLSGASGAELDALIDRMDLRSKIQSDLQQAIPRGSLPDPIDLPKAHQAQFEELAKLFPHKKAITPRMVRQWFGPALRKRYAAIGQILDTLTKEAGPKPEKPWNRAEVGPEEITQVAGDRQVRTFTPEEAANPDTVGDIATRNAAVDATGKEAPPRTVTKNVMAVADKSGRVVLVSTWKDPRTGPKATDPGAPNLPGRRIDPKFLSDYQPVAVMTLREPVKDFRQVFPDRAAFDKWFGDVGVEGTPGLRTSSFAGPEAGAVNFQAAIRGMGQSAAQEPPSMPEGEFVSPTARELTARSRVPPTMIPGEALPRGAGPEPRLPAPQPPEQLSPEGQQRAQAAASEAFPYEPTRYTSSAGLEQRGISIMPGARGLRPGPQPKRAAPSNTPGAVRKQQSEIVRDVKDALKNVILRMPAKADIFRLRDAADHEADLNTENAKESIIVASRGSTKPTTKADRQALEQRAKMNRMAAVAYVVSGGKLNKLKFYGGHLVDAADRAKRWAEDANPLKRREAALDAAYIKDMKAALQHARDHWKDPDFIATGKAVKENLASMLEEERKAGKTLEEYENYYPGVWEGEFWNSDATIFSGRMLLGQQYRMPKRFHDPFEAIADGPYRLASTDSADITAHRMRQGYRWIAGKQFDATVKSIRDRVTGEPIAMDAIPVWKDVIDPDTGTKDRALVGYKSPKPGYEVVGKADPIAMMSAYKQAYSWATAPSAIEQFAIGTIPVGKAALVANQLLKHNVILLWDTFHPGRLLQYATALTGFKKPGYRGGSTALSLRPEDIPKAIDSGYITKEAGDWALGKIDVQTRHGPISFTRQEILREMVSQGFNAKRFTDTLYKEAIQNVPVIGEAWNKIVGPWNDWMFNDYIPGMMAEVAVHNFEKMNAANPNTHFNKIMRDVARDTNIFFGNMGRQGIFKSRTAQDLGRLFLLAPLWQEGLFTKELSMAMRTLGAGARGVGLDLPYRRGLPAMGALGNAMGRGLFTYFVATQAINMLSRGHPTWQNEEEGHKLDAWVPVPYSKNGGFWLSMLSTFAEVTHDIIRLHATKPTWREAAMQLGMNRASPVAKMGLVGVTGTSPAGQRYATTPGWMAGAASQVIPGMGAAPITFSIPARAAAHALFPTKVSPNQPGAAIRQALAASAGIKTEIPQTNVQQAGKMTRDFMDAAGLRKDQGWMQVQTDQPSYAKLRTALRMDDQATATKMLKEIRKTHSDEQIEQAMKIWSKRPWTGSYDNDQRLFMSLTDKQLETFNRADLERLELLNSFYSLLMKN